MVFRFARHTNSLAALKQFYTQILGFTLLGEFTNHNQYNGIFLGKPNSDWHLEFTSSDTEANHTFDEDDALVFYPTTLKEYQSIISNIEKHQIALHPPKNPYWKENGILIKDPDRYPIIISNQKIS